MKTAVKQDRARIAWLNAARDEVTRDQEQARQAGQWASVSQMHLRLQKIRMEYDECRAAIEAEREAKASAKGKGAADYTPEEWAGRVLADAQAASVSDLDIYMQEWCQRAGYVVVLEAGEARMVRRATA